MKYAVVRTESSRIQRIVDEAPQATPDGVVVVEVSDELAAEYAASKDLAPAKQKHFLVDGVLKDSDEMRAIQYEQARADGFAANPAAFKARLIRKAQAKRNKSILAGFEFGGKQFQTRNPIDIQNIMNVGIAAQADPAFTTSFRSTDNTWVPLNNADCKAFYAAMVAAGAGVWAWFSAKEAEIAAANTLAELDAIEI